MNFYHDIKPRIELLKQSFPSFDFSEAMRGTDTEFCERF